MNIFVFDELDTAKLEIQRNRERHAMLDCAQKVKLVRNKDYVELRWRKQGTRKQKASLLYILRYWITPFGTRKMRFQCHKISNDGHIGSRNIIDERHNGRKVR